MATILIVEDDPTIGILLQEVIQRNMPSQVIWAICASEAIKAVENTMPDLLLLDYFLPDMNGIELYDHVQTILKERHIPTIMLTASLSSITPQLQERQIIGMSKPFHITELTSLIAKLAPLDIC
ncbi:MAG TPA: response regulator [Ktedonobacteraceae bacterium]|nr:response regulator [Ktedonobacteraceae bacterium]